MHHSLVSTTALGHHIWIQQTIHGSMSFSGILHQSVSKKSAGSNILNPKDNIQDFPSGSQETSRQAVVWSFMKVTNVEKVLLFIACMSQCGEPLDIHPWVKSGQLEDSSTYRFASSYSFASKYNFANKKPLNGFWKKERNNNEQTTFCFMIQYI